MIDVEKTHIIASLRLGDRHYDGYSNNGMVEVEERSRSWLKDTNIDCWLEMGSSGFYVGVHPLQPTTYVNIT